MLGRLVTPAQRDENLHAQSERALCERRCRAVDAMHVEHDQRLRPVAQLMKPQIRGRVRSLDALRSARRTRNGLERSRRIRKLAEPAQRITLDDKPRRRLARGRHALDVGERLGKSPPAHMHARLRQARLHIELVVDICRPVAP